MLTQIAISGYRSLRHVVLAPGPLTVVTGANGSGKSSLYRALRLLAEIAQGRLVEALAAEGGFESVRWAGPPDNGPGGRPKPIALRLGFAGDDYGYAIDLGLAGPNSPFPLDPEVKSEELWIGHTRRPATLIAERRHLSMRLRGEDGAWSDIPAQHLAPSDSMLAAAADPRQATELLVLRERMRAWRFYDELRTDEAAPARIDAPLCFTGALPGDGSSLGPALETLRAIGDAAALRRHVDDAFPGARLDTGEGFAMQQPGLLRPLGLAELSEGTLRYLLLVAALLAPRRPPLLVLNEPEAGLHPDLLAPLARLIRRAAEDTQVLVVSHAAALVRALEGHAVRIDLDKRDGATVMRQDPPPPPWSWPTRAGEAQ